MHERSRQDPVAPGDVVGGKYRVERVLGAGAMGLVVAARHKDIGQLVALKFLLPELLARYPGIVPNRLRRPAMKETGPGDRCEQRRTQPDSQRLTVVPI